MLDLANPLPGTLPSYSPNTHPPVHGRPSHPLPASLPGRRPAAAAADSDGCLCEGLAGLNAAAAGLWPLFNFTLPNQAELTSSNIRGRRSCCCSCWPAEPRSCHCCGHNAHPQPLSPEPTLSSHRDYPLQPSQQTKPLTSCLQQSAPKARLLWILSFDCLCWQSPFEVHPRRRAQTTRSEAEGGACMFVPLATGVLEGAPFAGWLLCSPHRRENS